MTKNLYLLVLLLACSVVTRAQQRPQYTQYIFNNYLLNPAVAGIENYIDTKLGYRSQWTGLEGAPVTSYFSINAPIGTDFLEGDATAFPVSGGQYPSSRMYTRDYRASEPHHGVGFMVVSDKAGPITQTNLSASYAYHLGITDRLNVSVGVSGGFNHIILNTNQITLENPNDPTINNLGPNQWRPDIGVGIWAYSSNYYFGVSAQQLLPQNLYLTSGPTAQQSKSSPHYFVTGGYKIFLTDEVSLLPSALIKFIKPAPVTFDVNMRLSFQDRFWFGGSYRRNDSFAAMAGFNLSSFVNVGYSYDMTTSALRTVSNGTHEIVLGIMLNNRYKITSPQHGW
ncbi:type IX secretion system membrane protein PorP/SprF [Mucilaginibacter pallidiroseus]|uniref:Type IX secretion system membrane protein PorP/SprF n=1 Tax=Mucilaginibacter pallidiroseus TaxID=2599295 RepID=A0A563UJZ4_9SPHI|nr:type IX secretion system membrane protein PorP/SprF [Mucilaginibacter pallidiroseus]TWR31697.1 type IX secretion system membrane protein PorP/SprF [Mucilaginibacter pallidiroseus]